MAQAAAADISQRTAIVFGAGRPAVAASIGAALVAATFVGADIGAARAFGWAALVVALGVVRLRLLARYRRDAAADAAENWLRRFDRLVAANGFAWGAGGVMTAFTASFADQVAFTLCVCGLFAGTIASYFLHLRAVLLFALPALVPLAVALIAVGQRESVVLGGCVLAFLGIATIVAVQIHETLRDTVPHSAAQAPRRSDGPLEQRRVEHLYRAAWITASGSLLGAACVVFLLREQLDLARAALWFGALAGGVALRLLKVSEFRHGGGADARPGYWLRSFNYPLVLVGITWSVGAISLPQSLAGDMLMVVAVFGIVAGAVAGFSSHMSSVLSLAVPAVLPFAVKLGLSGEEMRVGLGIGLIVFSILIIAAGARIGRIIREGFAHELENDRLIAELTQRNSTIEQLNDDLETRVRVRTEELELLVDELSERSSLLDLSRQQYAGVVEQTDDLIFGCDENGVIVFANRAWHEALDYEEDLARQHLLLLSLVRPEQQAALRDAVREVGAGEPAARLDLGLVTRAGPLIEVSGRLYPGTHDGVMGVFRNVTAARAADAALRSSEARFQAIFSRSAVGILILDEHLNIVDANPHAHEILGHPLDTLSGNAVRTIVGAAHRSTLETEIVALLRENRGGASLEMECSRGGQDSFWAELELSTIHDAVGRPRFVALFLYDISQRKALADVLRHNASHDYLTGLINRREFERRLGEAIGAATPVQPHALAYLDLDRFKLINDVCGHSTGDALLRRLSAELAERVPPDCHLARIGGDEFALLIPETGVGEAHVVTRALVKAIEDFRFEFENRTHTIGCSAGIVLLRGDETITEAMQSADAACYAAKRAGRNHVEIYNAEHSDIRLQRDQIRAATTLADALNTGRLHLYAQPIAAIDAAAGNRGVAEHYELLLRVEGDDGGVTGPAELLPAAEKYGYASEVDQWVVRETLAVLSQLAPRATSTLRLSVNLSAQSLQSDQFERFLADQLDACAFRSCLCFEITESHLMSNLARATGFMRHMRRLGCRFALDDFGTGFSSYGYLKALDVDYLKIDGTFVRNIDNNPVDEAIVNSIVGVARAIRMRTIAEYVEREAQLATLQRVGVDLVQGYLIGNEVPLTTIVDRLERASG